MFFSFHMPVKVIGGRDCVLNNGGIFSSFGKKCLIITGKNSAKLSGGLKDVTAVLEKENIQYDIYDNINENPLVSRCFEAGKKAREINADFLVGIGGGSVLDATKASAIFAAEPKMEKNDIFSRSAGVTPLPKILIGTTAGTGSEVSAVSVLTLDENGMKKSISGDDCYADVVFADSKYTCSASYDTTVSTALDALAHITEGFFSKKLTDTEKLFARFGIPLLSSCLKKLSLSRELPDEKEREKLYCASLYAGIVLNTCGTSFPHPLGYILTQYRHIPHGKACTAFMKPFLKKAKTFENEKFREFITLTGMAEDEFISLIEKLTDIKDISFPESELEEIAKRWDIPPKNFANTPGGFTKEEAISLFR